MTLSLPVSIWNETLKRQRVFVGFHLGHFFDLEIKKVFWESSTRSRAAMVEASLSIILSSLPNSYSKAGLGLEKKILGLISQIVSY